VYGRDPEGDAWVDVGDGVAPVTAYWSVEALSSENTMRFGTYGRGIWDLQLDPLGVGCFPVTDHDGDGVACDLDCDDSDPARYPGAVDACDGVDGDCDGTSPAEWDVDADGSPACADCDDRDRARYPGAPDLCGDGADQDCDGADEVCVATGAGCGGCGSGVPGRSVGGFAVVATLLARVRRRS
jgi:hypothetical protein